ncbi:MAG: CPBP family intramembrane glutamic endopeptidase [Myxococcota bacterium]
MKEAGKIIAYFAAVVILGAMVAPLLYWGGRWLADTGIFVMLGKVPFSRFFNRAVLISALALLWPFLRSMTVPHWRALGLQPNPRRGYDLLLGTAIGIAAIACVVLPMFLLGAAEFRDPLPWHKVVFAVGTGAVVALIEETFFRGFLFGVLRRTLSWRLSLAFLSMFFAVVHFLKPGPGVKSMDDIHWLSGFDLLPHVFDSFRDPQGVFLGWVTLVIFGWLLGYTVVRTRSLYLAVGLHAGFVFAMRAFAQTTVRRGDLSPWIGRDLTTGIVPVVLLLATVGVLYGLLRRRRVTDG